MMIKYCFIYGEFLFFAILYFTFIRPSRMARWAKALWVLWLLFGCSKFLMYKLLWGNAFVPQAPEAAIWFWNWAYSGAVILTVASCVWWVKWHREMLLAIFAWSAAAIGIWNGLTTPEVHEFKLTFERLPPSLEGYRIVQISDIHCSSAARKWRTQAIVERANSLDADLICVTGDLVDGMVDDLATDMEPLDDLRAKDGVFYINGNHEYYMDRKRWPKWHQQHGHRFLFGECVFPHEGLALGGVDDIGAIKFGVTPVSVNETFATATNGEFRILMQHRPERAIANIVEEGVDLQLSGHTHGGIMPGLRELVAFHNHGFSRGIYRFGKGTLYVSPGTGQWAGFPIRFFNPSEVTLIRLTAVPTNPHGHQTKDR